MEAVQKAGAIGAVSGCSHSTGLQTAAAPGPHRGCVVPKSHRNVSRATFLQEHAIYDKSVVRPVSESE